MKKEKTTKAPEYEASLKVMGKIYTATGASVKEAIANIKIGTARGMGLLTVSKGKESKVRVLPSIRTTRLFNTTGMTREVELTNAASLFGL